MFRYWLPGVWIPLNSYCFYRPSYIINQDHPHSKLNLHNLARKGSQVSNLKLSTDVEDDVVRLQPHVTRCTDAPNEVWILNRPSHSATASPRIRHGSGAPDPCPSHSDPPHKLPRPDWSSIQRPPKWVFLRHGQQVFWRIFDAGHSQCWVPGVPVRLRVNSSQPYHRIHPSL